MLRSVFQERLAALLIETALAARSIGVQQTVMDSLPGTFAKTPFPRMADTIVSKALFCRAHEPRKGNSWPVLAAQRAA